MAQNILKPDSDAFGGMYSGLTKREYIAIQAMQALITTSKFLDSPEVIARKAREQADELIKQLNKPAE